MRQSTLWIYYHSHRFSDLLSSTIFPVMQKNNYMNKYNVVSNKEEMGLFNGVDI